MNLSTHIFRLLTTLLIIIAVSLACKSSGKAGSGFARGHVKDGSNEIDEFMQIVYLAWNEDTVLTWQFNLYRDKGFLYTIHRQDSISGEIRPYSYRGKVKETADTLFLIYKGRKPSEKLTNFLVKEMSGSYLIQYFTDDPVRRMFLRCKKYDPRHGVFW